MDTSSDNHALQWIEWAKQIQAISQIGSTFSKDPYDLERYKQLKEIAYAMLANLANVPLSQVNNFFIPDQGYATPKVDLRAGVFQEDKILLVRERSDNKWTLPGGWADVCESPSQGIIREVKEESGYSIDEVRLVAIFVTSYPQRSFFFLNAPLPVAELLYTFY